MRIFKRYLIPVFVLAFLSMPLLAGAQLYQTCTDIDDADFNNTARLCYLFEDIADILFVLGLGLAIIALIVGGIAYITSGGDQARTDKAKKIITYGLIGAAIILLAWFIVDLLKEVIIDQLA